MADLLTALRMDTEQRQEQMKQQVMSEAHIIVNGEMQRLRTLPTSLIRRLSGTHSLLTTTAPPGAAAGAGVGGAGPFGQSRRGVGALYADHSGGHGTYMGHPALLAHVQSSSDLTSTIELSRSESDERQKLLGGGGGGGGGSSSAASNLSPLRSPGVSAGVGSAFDGGAGTGAAGTELRSSGSDGGYSAVIGSSPNISGHVDASPEPAVITLSDQRPPHRGTAGLVVLAAAGRLFGALSRVRQRLRGLSGGGGGGGGGGGSIWRSTSGSVLPGEVDGQGVEMMRLLTGSRSLPPDQERKPSWLDLLGPQSTPGDTPSDARKMSVRTAECRVAVCKV